jgi:hypothetical protein
MKTTDEIKRDNKELKDAIRQLLCTFNAPIVMMRFKSPHFKESIDFSTEILNRICEEDGEVGDIYSSR